MLIVIASALVVDSGRTDGFLCSRDGSNDKVARYKVLLFRDFY